jgi:hypothetical protein
MSEPAAHQEARPRNLPESLDRIKAATPSKVVPQILVALMYWYAILSGLTETPDAGFLAVLPWLTLGSVFYGFVIVRLIRAAPATGSLLATVVDLWFLFIGYTVWLGLVPPLGSRRWRDWLVWLLVISGLLVLIVAVLRSDLF